MAGTLYVAIRGEYSEFQKDLARVRAIARDTGRKIAEEFGQSIAPRDAAAGLNKLSTALRKVSAAAQNASTATRAMDAYMAEAARKSGVVTSVMRDLHAQMIRTARERALEKAFESIRREAGLTAAQLSDLKRGMGQAGSALDTAMGGLGIRSTAAIEKEMNAVMAAFDAVRGNARSTAADVGRAEKAMLDAMRRLNAEASAPVARDVTGEAFSTLGLKSEASIAERRKAIREAYEEIATAANVTARDVERANRAMAAAFARLDAEAGKTGTAVERAMGSLGVKASSTVRAEAAELRRALAQIAMAFGTGSDEYRSALETFNRKMGVEAQRTRTTLEKAWGTLHLRSSDQIRAEQKAITDALEVIRLKYGQLSQEFQRASRSMTTSMRTLETELQGAAGDVRSTLQKSMNNLGLRTAAEIRAEKRKIVAELRSLRNESGAESSTYARAAAAARTRFSELEAERRGVSVSDLVPKEGPSALQTMIGGYAKLAAGIYAAQSATLGLREAFSACLEAMIKIDALKYSYKAIYDSAYVAESQLAMVYDLADRTGLKFTSVAESAKGFFAASQGTTLANDANEIFKAFSNMGAALHLTGPQMEHVFLALSQMISKGKVQAEELRGQLGESLPGAFRIAAKAMGVTTAELDKMLSDGKVLAEVLLPKMAVEIGKFGKDAEAAANSAQGAVNRLDNEWTMFKANVMDSGAVVSTINAITSALGGLNKAMREETSLRDNVQEAAKQGVLKVGEDFEYQPGGNFVAFLPGGREKFDSWKTGRDEKEKAAQDRKNEQAKSEAALAAYSNNLKTYLKDTKDYRVGKEREALSSALKIHDDYMAAVAAQNGKESAEYRRLANERVQIVTEGNRKIKEAQEKGEKKARGGRSTERAMQSFGSSLDRLRAEVDAFNDSSVMTEEGIARVAEKLDLERQKAVKAAEEQARLAVARKSATQGQADEYVSLATQKAQQQYDLKMKELDEKRRSARESFYQGFNTTDTANAAYLDVMTKSIERQREAWMADGIAVQDVNDRIERMVLDLQTDPMSGFKRSFQNWADGAALNAQNMEQCMSSMFDTLSSGIARFVRTGKLSFDELASSFADMVAEMLAKAMISGLFGWIGGAFGSTPGKTPEIGMWGNRPGHANGGVFLGGGSLSSYSGSIVSSPTLFTSGRELHAYAKGSGLMGEAGPEAIMPLQRMSNGKLGVQASGGSSSAPVFNITVVNETGGQSTAEVQDQRQNSSGGFDIRMMIKSVVAGDISSGNGGIISQSIQGAFGLRRQVRGV